MRRAVVNISLCHCRRISMSHIDLSTHGTRTSWATDTSMPLQQISSAKSSAAVTDIRPFIRIYNKSMVVSVSSPEQQAPRQVAQSPFRKRGGQAGRRGSSGAPTYTPMTLKMLALTETPTAKRARVRSFRARAHRIDGTSIVSGFGEGFR